MREKREMEGTILSTADCGVLETRRIRYAYILRLALCVCPRCERYSDTWRHINLPNHLKFNEG